MANPGNSGNSTSSDRESFGSSFGFLLAAVGSAVGLGNMWRFSATASQSGGAAFVFLYILLTFSVGVPLLMAELSIGRKMRLSPVSALRAAGGSAWVPLGYLFVASGFLILAFYSVIAGWALRLGLEAIFLGLPDDPAAHFGQIATGPVAAVFHVVFVAATVLVVSGGVKKGIERAATVLMPALFIILVGLALWAAGLEGAGEGYRFYLSPDFSQILNPQTIADAAGQTYFSLSLGMGALLTFASYLGKEHNLPRESSLIAVSDFGVAFIAGLVVFPVIFALGFSSLIEGLSPGDAEGVLFIALPAAFGSMGTLGRAVGSAFFVALIVGALTSTISLLEVVVSSLMDETKADRKKIAYTIGGAVALVGILPALDIQWLVRMNNWAGTLFLGVGAFATVIFVGWFMDDPVAELAIGAGPLTKKTLGLWFMVTKYVLPIITGTVLYFMIQNLFFSA